MRLKSLGVFVALMAILGGAVWFGTRDRYERLPEVKPVSIVEQPDVETVGTPTSTKLIALTFDDGPYGTSTAQILDILKREHVPATFFVMGMNVKKYPDEAQRIVKDGHLIGNHSYDHSKKLPTLATSTFADDTTRTETLIASVTGVHAKVYRPPYGALSDTMRHVLRDEGYRTVLWNIDPEDWDYEKSPALAVVQRVESAARPNAIILLHDGRDTHVNFPRDNTVEALPTIIRDLKQKGYTFVTVDKL